ncbi:MAG TPA: SipW-dependent-type signal peptide-containing protein [Candidatus Limnocylindrales bacterium]|jgi:predicted ribosomally synthesized peptide with SipW-like signal peptide
MARHSLRIIIVLGVLITLVGGTGIFAVFSDRATVDNNSVTSGSRPKAADLRIEDATSDATTGQIDCNADNGQVAFDDENLTTGLYTATDVQPNTNLGNTYICLKNAGSSPLTLTVSVIDLSDLDIECTGDESAAGDTTCGLNATQQPQAGELSPLLYVEFDEGSCAAGAFLPPSNPAAPLPDTTAVGFASQQLQPGSVECLRIDMAYPSPTPTDGLLAQSDQTTWRFAFDGVAS